MEPALECGWYIQWSSTEENWVLFPSRLQLQITLCFGKLHVQFFLSLLRPCLAWTSTNPMCALTISVSSYVDHYYYVWMMLFLWSYPSPDSHNFSISSSQISESLREGKGWNYIYIYIYIIYLIIISTSYIWCWSCDNLLKYPHMHFFSSFTYIDICY